MTFLLPWGLLGLVAIPLILLLYILKQKREKLTVSSLVLWRKCCGTCNTHPMAEAAQ